MQYLLFTLSFVFSLSMNAQSFVMVESSWESDCDNLTDHQRSNQDSTALLPLSHSCQELPFDTLIVHNLDNFEGYTVWQLENHGLDQVNSIIKVELNWLGCCTYIESYYFLYTKDCSIIKLPMLENVACDFPEPYREYYFPEQVLGKQGTIQQINVDYDEFGIEAKIEVENIILWPTNSYDGCRR